MKVAIKQLMFSELANDDDEEEETQTDCDEDKMESGWENDIYV